MTTHVARCAARLWLTAIALSVHRTQTKKRHGNRGAGRKNVFHWMTFHVSGHNKFGSQLRLYANELRAPVRTEVQPISMSHMPKKQAPRSQSKWDKAWTNLSPDAEWVIHRFIQRFKG
jgi:hypothetical protein